MIQHTNRKGHTYFLHAGTRKDGKVHYYFATKIDESKLAECLPEGREIYEKPMTAQVFLRQAVKSQVTDEELALAKRLLAECCELPEYATVIERTGNEILIHEVAGSADLLEDDPGPSPRATSLQELAAKLAELEKLADPMEKVAQLVALQQDYFLAKVRSPEARRSRAMRSDYWPAFRYELELPAAAARSPRRFVAYRFHFSMEKWFYLSVGSLEGCLRKTVPHLGKESFFELGC